MKKRLMLAGFALALGAAATEAVTAELVNRIADEEIAKLGGDPARYADARSTFLEVAVADDFADFLTLPAYARMP